MRGTFNQEFNMTNWKVTSQMVWKTAKETAQSLGVSRRRVCQLAEAGRFGPNAYKKYDKSGNYNGAWMIPFPNDDVTPPVTKIYFV